MKFLVELCVVLMMLATLGFFAAFLFWVFVGLALLAAAFCGWAMIVDSGRPSNRSPVPEDPSG